MTAPRWVAAVGLCAILIALAVTLASGAQRRSGTNLTPDFEYILSLRPGQQACEERELLPADTAALRLPAKSSGSSTPPLAVTARRPDGQLITRGVLAAGWHNGEARVPVRLVTRAVPEARVCVSDREAPGGSGQLMLGGDRNDPGLAIQTAGYTIYQQHLRYEYLRPGRESWYQFLPTIAYRFSLGKAGFLRHWEWWAVLLLVIATIAVALWAVLQQGSWDEPASGA